MRYSLTHPIDTDLETFWNELFFDPEFNSALYLDHLKFATYRVVEDQIAPDGSRQRRIECVPKIDIPAAARAFFGNSAGYTELGRFDAAARRYYMDLLPAFGGDKVKMTIEIWAEPSGAKSILRHVDGEANVKIFGLTKLIEGITEQQARDTYARAAEFSNRWLREKRNFT